MKLKTSTGIYTITDASHENGKLNIEFQDKTCEDLQMIFSDKDSLARLEVYTDDDALMSVIPGMSFWRKSYCGTTQRRSFLQKRRRYGTAYHGTVRKSFRTAQAAGHAADAAAENTADIRQLQADLDYMAMSLEVDIDE